MPADRVEQRLGAEQHEVGRAEQLDGEERGLGRDEQRAQPRARGERPDRLPCGDARGGERSGASSPDQRVANRERRVLTRRDDHGRHGEEDEELAHGLEATRSREQLVASRPDPFERRALPDDAGVERARLVDELASILEVARTASSTTTG